MRLAVDDALVGRCRDIAARVATAVQAFVDGHTTVAIERTVLRAFGVQGADEEGVPLVNRCVERLRTAGALGLGVAYHIARELEAGCAGPQEAAEALAYGPGPRDHDGPTAAMPPGQPTPSRLPPRTTQPPARVRELLQPYTREALATLDGVREHRRAAQARLGMGLAPLKYVIVATGNIYDDADQARAAAQCGADIIAVIRSTAQSLLDYVPFGATTEGYGGTWATQENFRIVRAALDDEQERQGRYLQQVNYSSGLCMPEIAYLAAVERLDMLLNDAMYGILFRDINPRRTLCDQYFSRRIVARAGMVINTGEDNYLTTADAIEAAHTVVASQLINEALAHRAGLRDEQLGLGHAFEIDKAVEDSFLLELAQAELVRAIFPRHPIKWMPATKHKTGDIFWSHRVDGLFDLVGVTTGQSIELLGMMTEAVHNPMLMDRFVALKGADYVFRSCRHLGDEIVYRPDGRIAARARQVLEEACQLLDVVAAEGLFSAVARGVFADVKRPETAGRGLDGVVARAEGYCNPLLAALEGAEP
jgi:beta-lysine 5,6-aminomutase alpha subunit